MLLSPVWHGWRDGGFSGAGGHPVIVRVTPGELRAWDFRDEYGEMRG